MIDRLIKDFDLLAEARNGVQEIRKMVFQLAIQGRLVPQDRDDEPASVLLLRVAEEKTRLIEAGRIRKRNVLPPVNEEDIPYGVPSNWRWTTLDEIGFVNPRNDASDDLEAAFVPMPLISDRYGQTADFEVRLWGAINKGFTHFYEGDVACAKITPCFQNGKSTVFRALPNGLGAGTTELHVFRPVDGTVLPEYVWVYFKTPYFLSKGESVMTGSAGQKRVPLSHFAGNPFPLPPQAEQKRIVAKVDQLMMLCDALEACQKSRTAKRVALNGSCLHALTTARVPKAFVTAARRLLDDFDTLYETPETVAELRQTILQLAVQGKLVPHPPNAEPASVLQERIKAEKDRLVKEGKIKKQKPLPPVDQEDIPFDLPRNWQWVRIDDISELVTDGEHNTPPRISQGIPLVTAKNVRDGQMDMTVTDFVSREIAEICWRRCRPLHNDVLLVSVGATTGRLTLLVDPPEMVIVRSVTLIRPIVLGVLPEFMALTMRSPLIQSQIWGERGIKQSAQPCLYLGKTMALLAPLPPLEEQERVVAKVRQLMALCGELETRVSQAQADADVLAASIAHHLCSPNANNLREVAS